MGETVDGRNPKQPPGKWKTPVNNGISTTFPSTGGLIPDFWLPSTKFTPNKHEGTTWGNKPPWVSLVLSPF